MDFAGSISGATFGGPQNTHRMSLWNPSTSQTSQAPDTWVDRGPPTELLSTPEALDLPIKVTQILEWSVSRPRDSSPRIANSDTARAAKRASLLSRSRSLRAHNIVASLRPSEKDQHNTTDAASSDVEALRRVLLKLADHQTTSMDDRHEWEEEVMIDEYAKGQKTLSTKQDELKSAVEKFVLWKIDEVSREFNDAKILLADKHNDEIEKLQMSIDRLPGDGGSRRLRGGHMQAQLEREQASIRDELQRELERELDHIRQTSKAEFAWLDKMASRRHSRLETERDGLVAQINEQVLVDKKWLEVVWNRRWAMLDAHARQLLQEQRDGVRLVGLTYDMASRTQPLETLATPVMPVMEADEDGPTQFLAELPADQPPSPPARNDVGNIFEPVKVDTTSQPSQETVASIPKATSRPPSPKIQLTQSEIEALIQKYVSGMVKPTVNDETSTNAGSEAPVSSKSTASISAPSIRDSGSSFVTINTVATSIWADSPIDGKGPFRAESPAPPVPPTPSQWHKASVTSDRPDSLTAGKVHPPGESTAPQLPPLNCQWQYEPADGGVSTLEERSQSLPNPEAESPSALLQERSQSTRPSASTEGVVSSRFPPRNASRPPPGWQPWTNEHEMHRKRTPPPRGQPSRYHHDANLVPAPLGAHRHDPADGRRRGLQSNQIEPRPPIRQKTNPGPRSRTERPPKRPKVPALRLDEYSMDQPTRRPLYHQHRQSDSNLRLSPMPSPTSLGDVSPTSFPNTTDKAYGALSPKTTPLPPIPRGDASSAPSASPTSPAVPHSVFFSASEAPTMRPKTAIGKQPTPTEDFGALAEELKSRHHTMAAAALEGDKQKKWRLFGKNKA